MLGFGVLLLVGLLFGCANATSPGTSPATTYTVTFNSEGGSAVSSITNVASGATITLPNAPTLTGSTFEGWYTAINGGGTQFTSSTVVTANITVYANWVTNVAGTYVVSFDSQGGSTVNSIPNVTGGATITLPAAPTKTGYAFEGWYTAANGGGTKFTSSTPVTASLTVYADWAVAYTVTYTSTGQASGAAPIDTNSPYIVGATVTVMGQGTLVAAAGYVFAGWKYNSTTYVSGQTFSMPAANVTLAAVWVNQQAATDVRAVFDALNYITPPSAVGAWNYSGSGASAGLSGTGAIDVNNTVTVTITYTNWVDAVTTTNAHASGYTVNGSLTISGSFVGTFASASSYSYAITGTLTLSGTAPATTIVFNATETGSSSGSSFAGSVTINGASIPLSGLSSSGSTTTSITPPAAPTVEVGFSEVILSWAAVTGTSVTYNVKYAVVTISGGTDTVGSFSTAVSGTSSTSATVTNLTNGTLYAFEVTAVIGGSESAASPVVYGTPNPEPIELGINYPGGADANGFGYLFAYWAPVPGAQSYSLYYSTTLPVTAASPKLTSFTGVYGTIVSGLTVGQTYYFGVSSTAGGVESAIYSGGNSPITVQAESGYNNIMQISSPEVPGLGILFGVDTSAPSGNDGSGGAIYAAAGSTVTLTVNYVGGLEPPALYLVDENGIQQNAAAASTGYETFSLTAPSKGTTATYNFYDKDQNVTFNFSMETFSITGQ